MIGVMNIGLGSVFLFSLSIYIPWYETMTGSMYPFWLGGLLILFGLTNIFSGKFPSRCLVLTNAVLSVCAIGFALTGIVQ